MISIVLTTCDCDNDDYDDDYDDDYYDDYDYVGDYDASNQYI
jgi:hypothetical protein